MSLHDQVLLAEIANTNTSEDVRWSATDKLTDQAALAKVATNDKEVYVRRHAVEKLTDHEVLARIATSDPNGAVRLAAVRRVHDQVLLAEIAKTDSEPDVRKAAHDEFWLAKLAASHPPGRASRDRQEGCCVLCRKPVLPYGGGDPSTPTPQHGIQCDGCSSLICIACVSDKLGALKSWQISGKECPVCHKYGLGATLYRR